MVFVGMCIYVVVVVREQVGENAALHVHELYSSHLEQVATVAMECVQYLPNSVVQAGILLCYLFQYVPFTYHKMMVID